MPVTISIIGLDDTDAVASILQTMKAYEYSYDERQEFRHAILQKGFGREIIRDAAKKHEIDVLI